MIINSHISDLFFNYQHTVFNETWNKLNGGGQQLVGTDDDELQEALLKDAADFAASFAGLGVELEPAALASDFFKRL